MKKIVNMLLAFIVVLGLSGCNSLDNKEKINVDVLESKVDYFVFRNKKIYLTEDLEQYIMQFQDFECKLNGSLEIDNINSKEHKFYQLIDDSFEITCPSLEIADTADYYVIVRSMTFEEDDVKSIDREIENWRISGGDDEGIEIYIDGKRVVVDGENASTKSDIIDIMGSDYEYEESLSVRGYYHLIYEFDGIQYEFGFNKKDELFSVWVNGD